MIVLCPMRRKPLWFVEYSSRMSMDAVEGSRTLGSKGKLVGSGAVAELGSKVCMVIECKESMESVNINLQNWEKEAGLGSMGNLPTRVMGWLL